MICSILFSDIKNETKKENERRPNMKEREKKKENKIYKEHSDKHRKKT